MISHTNLWQNNYFYTNLNRLEDRVLEAHNYSREEIEQGLHDLSAEYGINLS